MWHPLNLSLRVNIRLARVTAVKMGEYRRCNVSSNCWILKLKMCDYITIRNYNSVEIRFFGTAVKLGQSPVPMCPN